MLFKEHHIKGIIAGVKTQTRRDWKRCMVKVGGIYLVKKQMLSKEWYAKIQVTGIRRERLGDISTVDAFKEGGYTVAEYICEWKAINGDWTPDLEVYVIDFELVDSQRELLKEVAKDGGIT